MTSELFHPTETVALGDHRPWELSDAFLPFPSRLNFLFSTSASCFIHAHICTNSMNSQSSSQLCFASTALELPIITAPVLSHRHVPSHIRSRPPRSLQLIPHVQPFILQHIS